MQSPLKDKHGNNLTWEEGIHKIAARFESYFSTLVSCSCI